jgi:hypothetical protein
MSYKINPGNYCSKDGCTRPKATGELVCSQCLRLARATSRELAPEVEQLLADEPKPPRCIAYLSTAGDVITLELTGEPKFTEADVAAVAAVLSNLRKAA